ncbi:MAG: hypothetical protein GXP49_13285 [Deltaproteobacteria bacterium]|nr:hypothetical protein [Deltaproteobacteria bacterium]
MNMGKIKQSKAKHLVIFLALAAGTIITYRTVDARTLSVVCTCDLHGRIEPRVRYWSKGRKVGGLAYFAGYLQILKQANDDQVLLLDAGDMWQGTLVSDLAEGRPIVKFYNMLGYEAVAIGNHEFDFGPKGPSSTPTTPLDDCLGAIKENSRAAGFPFLLANAVFRDTGKPIAPGFLKPSVLIEQGGIPVGIIGVTTVSTGKVTNPANVTDITFTPTSDAVKREIFKLRHKGASIIIVLAHMGAHWDTEDSNFKGEVIDLARAIGPGALGDKAADLICAAHTHSRLDLVVHGVPVVQAYAYGTAFSRVDIPVDDDSGRASRFQVLIHPPQTIWADNGGGKTKAGRYMGKPIVRNKKIADAVEKEMRPIRRLKTHIIGTLKLRLTRMGKFGSPLGALVTRAMLSFVPGADLAVTNSGAIRSDLGPGVITYGALYKTLPFTDHLVSGILTGRQLFKMFEESLDNGLLELAGATVTLDPSAPVGHRITSVKVHKKGMVRPDGSYKVVFQDFLLAGGDGYTVFKNATGISHHEVSMRESVVKYIQNNRNINRITGRTGNITSYKLEKKDRTKKRRHGKKSKGDRLPPDLIYH